MRSKAGYRLRVAPRFHSPIPWPERLRVSDADWRDDLAIPEAAWRPATEAELSMLLGEGAAEGANDFCLFTVPDHVRSLWWELAASAEDPPDIGPLARAVADFAGFKGLLLPSPASFDMVLTPPGQTMPREGGTAASSSQPAAGINLGDERTSVLMLPMAEKTGEQSSSRFPLIRLFLEPSEGVWVPCGGGVWDGYTAGKQEIDVWLVIRGEKGPPK